MNKYAVLLFVLLCHSGFSQTGTNTYLQPNKLTPVVIFNDTIIGNLANLKKLQKIDILELLILKSEKLSDTYLFFNKEPKTSIVKVTTNKTFTIKTQKELNNFFGLPENNPIYLHGFLLENKDYKIINQCITSIEFVKTNMLQVQKPALNLTIY